MTNTINNGALYSEELLSEEQLDTVQGGLATELIIAGVTFLVERGFSEADSLRDFVHSDDYKKMSNSDKNMQLGKRLANSVAFNAAIGGIATPFAVIGAQIALRTKGTGDDIRHGIEKIF